jgi:hypothetical protein
VAGRFGPGRELINTSFNRPASGLQRNAAAQNMTALT